MISRVHRMGIFAGLIVAAAVALCAPAPFAASRLAAAPAGQADSASPPTLDYEFFKTKVEPIFLKRRSPDHARCYTCHEVSKHVLHYPKDPGNFMDTLNPGSSFWTEEQSRHNFQVFSKLVVPGKPLSSRLLIFPLSPLAGGNADNSHSGGWQFESQDDPDWQTIADWVRGEKASGSSAQ